MSSQTERLNLKILRSDKTALRRLAAIEGETLSVLVRRILRKELNRHGWSPLADNNEQREEVEQ